MLTPPIARRTPTTKPLHGHVLTDNYPWLRDKSNPEVAAYLNAENAYADGFMKPTEPLQKKLYEEMLSHIKETDDTVPYKNGEYFYAFHWEAGKQYQIYGRKLRTVEAPATITLDVNALAAGEPFMQLGVYEVADDATLLAFSTDNTGFRQYRLRIRDLCTGNDLPDTAEKTGAVAWAADNKTIFYTVEDHAKRHHRLYRHVLGTPAAADVLVYEETDERFNIYVHRSRSKKFLFLTSQSLTTTEVRYLDAQTPAAEWNLIAPRRQDVEYYPDHAGELFYIRTNDTGRNFRLVSTPVADHHPVNWRELVPLREHVMLADLVLFEKFYVLVERENALPHLTVTTFATVATRRVPFPEPAYSAQPHVNMEFGTTLFRYAYQSLVTPRSILDYDIDSGESVLLKRQEIPGGYNPARYATERLWITARDGAKVPVSLVYRKDLKKPDGTNPLYVYGYGSYGYPLPVRFDSNRLCLLDRGFVLAYAHIRGGGDLGKPWHDAGRMMNKMNTFTDFIDCTLHLVDRGYGDRRNVAIEGGSAGGLLMGAVANLRPDLFRSVVSHVPFVDVLNSMLDASLPLTVCEYEEWGNPNEKAAFDYMRQYSPYDNLKRAGYPAMLVKTSFHDSQVMYWEPAKYVAKLRTLKTDDNILLLKTNMQAGHGGASGRYDHLKESAFDYAFILALAGAENHVN